jgi:hypothetical protein
MSWLRTMAGELVGLFVDDGSFAVAVLAWLVVCWLALPRLPWSPGMEGALLFVGLALILVESVWRRTRKR